MPVRQLCAIFEDWFLGDGIYPAFRKGQQQQLSFILKLKEKRYADRPALFFTRLQDAEYHFCGRIIRNYKIHNGRQVVLIETGAFIFYFEEPESSFAFTVGHFLEGRAHLYVDYNLYFENLDHSFAPFANLFLEERSQLMLNYCMTDHNITESADHVPDIIYQLSISEIIKVNIPERFIKRKDNALSYPTSLTAAEYSWQDMHIVTDMSADNGGSSFYLLHLNEPCLQ